MGDGAINGALKGLITGVTIAVVFGLIFLMGKLAGGGAKKQAGETVLRYGGMFRGLGLLCVLLVVIVLVVFAVGRITGEASQSEGAAIAVGVLCGIFLLPGLPLLIEGYRRQITLSETGIAARGWFGPVGELRWEEITSVENKVMSGKYVVRGASATIKIGHYLEGLDVFAEECKKRLAPEVYGDAFDKPVNRPFL
jgi:hypothetical protein